MAGFRFTPTHVGNTKPTSAVVHRLPVHPHARGEYPISRAASAFAFGSPPRTWGIRVCFASDMILLPVHPHARGEYDRSFLNVDLTERFTPTHVGNTPVHGRRGGPAIGSPPRTWGIRR